MRTGRLVVDVADLRRRAGTRRPIRRTAVLGGLAVNDVAVVEGSEVEVEAVIESISDQVVVDGTVRADWVGSCRRCLEEVRGRVETEVREVFEPRPVEGETYALAGETLDLEPMVRDAVLLNLPLAPLCDVACRGPDPANPVRVGDDEADADAGGAGGEGGGEGGGDPRWAALRELRFE
jgi:uncharacterized protein